MGHTTVIVDDKLKEEAKRLGINMSRLLEDSLRVKLKPTIKDLPEEVIIIKCSSCGKEITEGFLCQESKRVLCKTCEEGWNHKVRCLPYYQDISYSAKSGIVKAHEHIFWRGKLNHRPIGQDEFVGVFVPVDDSSNPLRKDDKNWQDNPNGAWQ